MKELISKQFEGKEIRTSVKDDGSVWFVAKDVMDALGIKNTSMAMRKLKKEERDINSNDDTSGRSQEMTIVNESGLYALIFQSRKKEAADFRYWVTNEVLPSIRKTGTYSVAKIPSMTPAEQLLAYAQRIVDNERAVKDVLLRVVDNEKNDTLTHDQATELDRMMNEKFKSLGEKDYKVLGYIKKQVKAEFFTNPSGFTFKEIPRHGFDRAIEIVNNFKVPMHLKTIIQ